ncbi:amino acid ABC transporter substrate-binding protein [Caballeronia sp. AZ10_KS36]|uniref:amino acid ABC transporter substrate-binding protein n=1 Tax=Caballeronia sp. AZ10_KS36 TaxID=2921757 RepID=UPI0020289417|nr:amino acid ABC transporter substrate-binding protein [Caballeronia sp. AZ10_KS36]
MKEAVESIRSVVLAGVLIFASPAASLAAGSETLAQVEARGVLRCGVSEGIAGFSVQNASGRWTGMDADFCRAVAAAVLGDPDKVAFVPLRTSARFPALRTRRIDLLARNTTWTLLREGTLGVQFAGVLFYDAQAFMVWTKSPIRAASSLNGATVCVQRDTSSEGNLSTYAHANALDLKPLVVTSVDALERAFLDGQCSAVTGDASLLGAIQARAPGGASSVFILPERISREPLGPVVRDDDIAWLTVVRWVLFTLIIAEEFGVTRANYEERMRDPRVARALVPDPAVTNMLGIKPGWTARALSSVGNYGEMFDRNLGTASPLQMKRGLNESWMRGGLMYAPPMQ